MATNYWLFKTEPSTYSIDDLRESRQGKDVWDGVRNFQARNFLRDDVKKGDFVFIYHSSCKVPGIAGLAKVTRAKCPDPTSWDKNSPYYDPKSTKENPRWFMVEIVFVRKFKKLISLDLLKSVKELHDFQLLKKGNRLSIIPVSKEYSDVINGLLKQ
ncbi:MAG: EVE domain-containing protein [Bdellovibrionota bacterium]|nr:EVE domain-containing protein [Bdellovibrionota bacterium]